MTNVDLFHYNKKTKEYKSLNINPTDDGDSVFASITSGNKEEGRRDKITLKLNAQEFAFLIMQAKKIFDEFEASEDYY